MPAACEAADPDQATLAPDVAERVIGVVSQVSWTLHPRHTFSMPWARIARLLCPVVVVVWN